MEQFNFYAVSIRFARAFGLVVTGYRDGRAIYGVRG